ncbi:hypothetical protein ONZ45_g8270 [Pleurotus djamor]|nr:hypothetical protein ONZ45_g8270 [Pleurotus djamor]
MPRTQDDINAENCVLKHEFMQFEEARLPPSRAQAIALQPECNAHSAFSKLPDDIISVIFEQVKRLYLQDHRRDKPLWLNVARVCHRWHDIAMADPLMWNDVELNMIPNHLSKCLRLSKFAPLTIRCRKSPLCMPDHYKATQIAMSEFIRIEVLDIVVDSVLAARHLLHFIRSDDVSAPHLRAFSLGLVGSWKSGENDVAGAIGAPFVLSKKFLRRNFPNLHTLDLGYGTFDCTLPSLPSLVTLSFCCPQTALLTIRDLADSLCNTPNLQFLTIKNAAFHTTNSSKASVASLPCLRYLEITTTKPRMTIIFNIIDYPSTARIFFHSTGMQVLGPDELTRLSIVSSHVFTPNSGFLLHVSFSSSQFHLYACGENSAANAKTRILDILLPLEQSLEQYLTLCTAVPLRQATRLTIEALEENKVNSHFLRRFERVERLELRECSGEICESLLTGPDGDLPLPALVKFLFHRCNFLRSQKKPGSDSLREVVMRILDERRRLSRKRFEYIQIDRCYIDKWMVEEFKKHVHVTWDHRQTEAEEPEDEESEDEGQEVRVSRTYEENEWYLTEDGEIESSIINDVNEEDEEDSSEPGECYDAEEEESEESDAEWENSSRPRKHRRIA